MATLAFLLQTAVVARALFLLPFEGRRKYERLAAAVRVDPSARARFFVRFLAHWWLLALAVLASVALSGEPLSWLSLQGAPGLTPWGLLAAFTLAFGFPLLRVHDPAFRRALEAQLAKVSAILPSTRRERALFAAVAVTAGVCEELVFRGLIPAWSDALLPGRPWVGAILSIAGFGLAHAYQGRRGILLTTILGGAFFATLFFTGSLLLPMALHALNDLRVLALIVALDRPPAPSAAQRPQANSPGDLP